MKIGVTLLKIQTTIKFYWWASPPYNKSQTLEKAMLITTGRRVGSAHRFIDAQKTQLIPSNRHFFNQPRSCLNFRTFINIIGY